MNKYISMKHFPIIVDTTTKNKVCLKRQNPFYIENLTGILVFKKLNLSKIDCQQSVVECRAKN